MLAPLLLAVVPVGGEEEAAAEPAFPRPEITVYGNAFGRAENEIEYDLDGNRIDDVIRLRQVDLDVRSALTEDVGAVVVFSVESDPNNTEHELEFERAYLDFRGLPMFHQVRPWNLRFRIGHYRTHFGWLNQTPITDLPQITRPRSQQQFFGEDGYAQLGFAMMVDLPIPSEEDPIVLTVEQIESGDRPFTQATPSGRVSGQGIRLEWRTGSEDASQLVLGASRFRGQQADQDSAGLRSTLVGFDALYSRGWRTGGEPRGFHLGGEWIDGEIDRVGAPADEPTGYYVWSQLQVSSSWYVGARYDLSQELADPSQETRTLGAFVAHEESERLRYALGIESVESDSDLLDGAVRVFAELNFAFGDSIRRPFWVRR